MEGYGGGLTGYGFPSQPPAAPGAAGPYGLGGAPPAQPPAQPGLQDYMYNSGLNARQLANFYSSSYDPHALANLGGGRNDDLKNQQEQPTQQATSQAPQQPPQGTPAQPPAAQAAQAAQAAAGGGGGGAPVPGVPPPAQPQQFPGMMPYYYPPYYMPNQYQHYGQPGYGQFPLYGGQGTQPAQQSVGKPSVSPYNPSGQGDISGTTYGSYPTSYDQFGGAGRAAAPSATPSADYSKFYGSQQPPSGPGFGFGVPKPQTKDTSSPGLSGGAPLDAYRGFDPKALEQSASGTPPRSNAAAAAAGTALPPRGPAGLPQGPQGNYYPYAQAYNNYPSYNYGARGWRQG